MLRAFLSLFIDIVLPPRQSETLMRTMRLEDLAALQTEEGLPYHDARVRALVWEIKYYANPRAAALGGALLAPAVLERAAEEVGRALLVPVPMHKNRLRERGHNQTTLLCSTIVKEVRDIDYAPDALVRILDTPHQQGLARHIRLRNVKGSMRASAQVKDRACIIIDDVTTTGATLKEARRALKVAGARAVHTVTLAFS